MATKICKYCKTVIDSNSKYCTSCGAAEFDNVCTNCGNVFGSAFCPVCGVNANDDGTVCPRCGKTYYTASCPNCGYNPTASTVQSQPEVYIMHAETETWVRRTNLLMILFTIAAPYISAWIYLFSDKYTKFLKIFNIIVCILEGFNYVLALLYEWNTLHALALAALIAPIVVYVIRTVKRKKQKDNEWI